VVAGWPVRGGQAWPPGLPASLTALVGRERELAVVARLGAVNRLVTLIGAGGVGKTRLAIEAAAALAPRFADGVDLVDLGTVLDPALLWAAVARVVGAEESADAGLAPRLLSVLRPQRRLLVLDNCEHLLAGCASMATQLLGDCPEVSILATSRESLGVPGEVRWRVPSLTFPWPDRLPSVDELERFGAVALFVARARAVRPGLVIGAADTAALTSICFRLDGIPLALELAAARVSALSIEEIAGRLDDRFTLLSRAVGGPARHQTLRASVEWSHLLLSQPERTLFRRLAVFAGGWSLAAAEAVGAGSPVELGQVARLMAALVDKSLVQAEDSATGSRYRLLEAIRAFANEQLIAAGELDDARARHAAYFADLAEQVACRLHGPDQDWWAWCLDQDQANLRTARQWCAADTSRASLGLKMASGLWEYWLIRGLLEEGIAWLCDVLQHASGPAGAQAAALTGLAVFTGLRDEFARGCELCTASIDLYEQAGDRPGQARAGALLGYFRACQGDPQGAAQAFGRALALAGASQDGYCAATTLLLAGMAAPLMGKAALARKRATESLELFTEIGDRWGASRARCLLADCLISEGNPAAGLAALRVCISDSEAILDRWGLLISTSSVAMAHAALGDWHQAAFVVGVVDSLRERLGGRPFLGVQTDIDAIAAKTATTLGEVAVRRRQAGRAVGRHDHIADALGLAPKPVPPDPARQDQALTRREHEITQLIAAGLTNRQIAARLVIAQRTVDTHVGHILAKLGCSNRSQVAVLTGTPPASGRSYATNQPAKIRTPST
jgi:predicted ATPase/DNA-binding CsgD family transcriptional regulator